MSNAIERRRRLAQVLDLAQNYRGWTRKELARRLGRDPTKLIPGSGIPKLDLVVKLAQVLDWKIDDVVSFFWASDENQVHIPDETDFEVIDTMARKAHQGSQYTLMIDLALHGFKHAVNDEQRARACNREAGGWDGLGRYQDSMQAVQRGLQVPSVSGEFRRMMQSNLANAYYSLWSLVEARAIASDLLDGFAEMPAETVRDRKTHAFAYYVSGQAYRRLMSQHPELGDDHAAEAVHDLTEARSRYLHLAEELSNESLVGIARTCEGALVEVDTIHRGRDPHEALSFLAAGLDEAEAGPDELSGDLLESLGWWCIFGCNIALTCLDDERALQKHMAIFTMKADEIADRLDNWQIRERVFTMEHMRWERAVGCTGFDIPCLVDDDDVRVITGTMARFPTFQPTGWKILQSASVVGKD